jgi:type I restriction enzyme S subunit
MKRWPVKPLGEVCDVRIGRTPRRDDPRFWGGNAVWVTVRELNGGEIRSSNETVSDIAVRECMPKPVPAGTLLFSFKLSIGKMAVAGCPLYTNEAIAALPIKESAGLTRDFLRYALLRGSHEGTADTAVMGKVLNKQKVRSLPIPVPPLAEQERIVKLLDEADGLRNLRAQADHRTADLIPALFHEMFGDPATNPKGWPVKAFGELTTNQDGRRRPIKASDRARKQGEFPYYGASGVIDHVGEFLFDGAALLIGEDGANLLARSTPVAFMASGKYWVNNHAHVVLDNGKADLAYLCAAFGMLNIADYITGSAQPKLNQANLNRIPVPVPPLQLQRDFAQRVAEIREIESVQAAGRGRLDALFQSMLHRAFNGEI